MNKMIIAGAGHSEWEKKDNPRETEIAKLFCAELKNMVINEMQFTKQFNCVVLIVPGTVTGQTEPKAWMNKVYYVNTIQSRSSNPKIFIDFHCDWSDVNKSANGWTMFYNDIATAKDVKLAEASKKLAGFIGAELTGFNAFKGIQPDNKSTPGSLATCSYTTVPSLLIETGFLSNEKDNRDLNDPHFRNRYVRSMWNGIKKYFDDYELNHWSA